MLIKSDYSGYTLQTGDETLDAELKDQLKISADEIVVALNDAGLVAQLLKQIVKVRSERHATLIKKLA